MERLFFVNVDQLDAHSNVGGITKIRLRKGEIIKYQACRVLNKKMFRIFSFNDCQISILDTDSWKLEQVP
jgi:hypothetical protein